MNTPRRLYRCRNDRRVAGVAAGVAEFFDLDPSVVRVVWFISFFFGGLGLFLYIAMALIVPLEPLADAAAVYPDADPAADPATMAAPGHRHAPRGQGRWSLYFGIGLVMLGAIALVNAVFPGWDAWRYLGPAFFVGIGVVLIAGALRRESTQP